MHITDAYWIWAMNTQPSKKPANLSLDRDLLSEAKALNINVSSAAETGVREAVRSAKAARWLEENAKAIESSNHWVEKHGIPLERYRQF